MFDQAIEYGLNVLANSGDPKLFAESLARVVSFVGLKQVIFNGYLFYLPPLLLVGLVATGTCFVRQKNWLVRWPDFGLLVFPALLWLILGIVYPIGRPTVTIWELVLLGTIAGLTILFRYRFLSQFRTGFANAGLLGLTSLAICFWAFMPSDLFS